MHSVQHSAVMPGPARRPIVGMCLQLAGRFPSVVLAKLPPTLRLHLVVGMGLGGLSALLLWPITTGEYPPGVDTPAFLHLSWVAKLAVSGQLANPLQDPYWYGGFSYLTYPPLAYGLAGGISALTPIGFVGVYNFLLVLSYGGLGFATWILAREFGLHWWSAVVAGVLATIAYPALSAVFLWGWSTSVMALPFALVSLALLERSLRRGVPRLAVLAGVLLAVATLTHHMTSLALGLGLVPWIVYRLLMGDYPRHRLLTYGLVYGITTAVIIAPWAIPFLKETAQVGFRREIPGNWLPEISTYRSHILDSSLVGVFIYPSYLDIALIILALAGTFIVFVERHRLAAVALILLALTWFSMGLRANPLIAHYPFSGLDIGRFQMYMVPFMALLAATAAERILVLARDTWPRLLPSLGWRVVVTAVLALVLVHPAYTAWQARSLVQPYLVQPQVRQALDWLAATPPDAAGGPAKVFAVGLWNWHSFLVPAIANRPLVDGWHDEGAANVRLIRRLRGMAWISGDPVDALVAHRILTKLGASYVLLHRAYWSGERTSEFWEEFERHPSMFKLRQQWGDVAVFQVMSPGTG